MLACALAVAKDGPSACIGVTQFIDEATQTVTHQTRKGLLAHRKGASTWIATECNGVAMATPEPAPKIVKRKVIAICAGATSRKSKRLTLSNQALFNILLPSVARNLEKGFEFWVYVAYDRGDAFYDRASNQNNIQKWFQEHVQAKNKDIPCKLKMVKNLGQHKPGPAFNLATKQAYDDGADYFFRVNDDSELLTPFASQFVIALKQFCPPNLGVVGPTCRQGATAILTHDFTHRSHLEIFQRYYPAELTDWWLDDWVTHVYDDQHTVRLSSVRVKHHLGFSGTRYSVNGPARNHLARLVSDGHRKFQKYATFRNYKKCTPEFGSVTSALRTVDHVDRVNQQDPPCHFQLITGISFSAKPTVTAFASSTEKCCGICSSTDDCVAFWHDESTAQNCHMYHTKALSALTSADINAVGGLTVLGIDPKAIEGIADTAAALSLTPVQLDSTVDATLFKINFGPDYLKLPPGFDVDNGMGYRSQMSKSGLAVEGWGWHCALKDSVRHRADKQKHGAADPMRSVLHSLAIMDRHHHCPKGAVWTAQLPAGTYLVTVGYSDPSAHIHSRKCLLQGIPAKGSWVSPKDHPNQVSFHHNEYFAAVKLGEGERLSFKGIFGLGCSSISYLLAKAVPLSG